MKKKGKNSKKRKEFSKKNLYLYIILLLILITIFLFIYSFKKSYDDRLGLPSVGIGKEDLYPLDNIYCGNKICEENENSTNCPSDCEYYPEFFLKVGDSNDNDSSKDIFLESSPNSLTDIITDPDGFTYRGLKNKATTLVKIKSESLYLSDKGIPYKDAVIEIGYLDNFSGTLGKINWNLPSLWVRLDYGNIGSNYGYPGYLALTTLGGNNDSQWKNVSFFLENNPWQSIRSIDGNFTFMIKNPSSTFLLIDHIKLSFYNKTDFEDLRDLDRATRGWTRTEYLDNSTLDTSSFGDKQLVIYAKNYLQNIFPKTIPKPEELTDSISSFEIAGNYEPLTFAFYALKDTANIKLNATNLVKGDDKIDSGNISIGKVEYIDMHWNGTSYGKNPGYINYDYTSFNVLENYSQQMWITIYVPDNTKNGIYDGIINVYSNDILVDKVNISLQVFNLKLEDPYAIPYLIASPYTSTYSDIENVSVIDIGKHGLMPYFFEGNLTLNQTLNTYSVDLSGINERMRLLKDLGVLYKDVFIADSTYIKVWSHFTRNFNYFNQSSPESDNTMRYIFNEYKKYLDNYNVSGLIQFGDEPGANINSRMSTTHLNKLAKDEGLRTTITYHPPLCELPLAGFYNLTFKRKSDISITKQTVPNSILSNPLIAYYNFENNGTDISGNNYNLGLFGAIIANGTLNSFSGKVSYAKNDSVHIPESNFSLSFWFEVDNPGNVTVMSLRSLMSSDGFTISQELKSGRIYFRKKDNYVAYLNWQPEYGKWHNLACTIKNTDEIRCFGDGIYRNFYTYSGYGNHSSSYLSVFSTGIFLANSSIDDLIIINKSISDNELMNFTPEVFNYQNKKISFNTIINYNDLINTSILRFTIFDKIQRPDTDSITPRGRTEYLGNKILSINENDIPFDEPAYTYLYSFNISKYLVNEDNNITLSFYDNQSEDESLLLYFVDDYWRNMNWTIINDTDDWSYYYNGSDQYGDLSPMDPYLDIKMHAMYYVYSPDLKATWASFESGDELGYYTTYFAAPNFPTYNRYLHGIYPSSINATKILVYAYAGWGSEPYDWFEAYYPYALKSPVDAQLAFPSWNNEMNDRPNYESLREGIEDSKIIATLKKEIQDHPGEIADEANSFLNNLFSGTSKNFWIAYGIGVGDHSNFMIEDISGNPNNYNFFQDTRRTMISYIIQLDNNSQQPDDNNIGSSSSSILKIINNRSKIVIPNQNDTKDIVTKNENITENPEIKLQDKQNYIIIYFILIIILLVLILIIIIVFIKQRKGKENLKNSIEKINYNE